MKTLQIVAFTRRLARALLAPLTLLAASCGVGGLLAASGGGGGGGGSAPPPPPPPTVTVIAPSEIAVGGLVTFAFVLRDEQVKPERGNDRPGGADDPRVRVRAQWEDPNAPGTWIAMSEADVPLSQGARALALGQHTFVWNTLPDLGGVTVRHPDTGAETSRFPVRVRVLAEYEEASGIRRTFRARGAEFTIDNRFTGTVVGDVFQPGNDIDSVPVAIRPDGDAFIVAVFGPNIVERVDASGLVRRLLGLGLPGDTVGTGKPPGVARLQTLIGVELDTLGNLYTNHSSRILVTNRGGASVPAAAAPLQFGASVIPPFTVAPGIAGLQDSRDVRFHPSGALLFLDQARLLFAFNPQDPADMGSTPITLAGVSVAPGDAETIAGGGASDLDDVPAASALLEGAIALAVGPDGEIYWVEQARARVRVLNAGTTDLVVGGNTVTAGTVRTVAGSGTGGFLDDVAATSAQLSIPTSIDVSPERGLFIADTANARIRLANLGVAGITFAEKTVPAGDMGTIAGGGTGGVGSKARELKFAQPNAVSIDANGNLLVADERTVIFVNGGTTTVTSYGRTARAARTTRVYDASRRAGVPLAEPRAVHSASPSELYFSDRATVRVLNLSRDERTFGGEAAAGGATAIVGGGAVPGFGGDGGAARNAAFSFPSALATQGRLRLFVADTGNDRVRLVNLGDPRLSASDTDAYLGQIVLPGDVATVVGGSPVPLALDGDGGPAVGCSLAAPEGVAVGPDGLVWVSDTGHHRIRVVNPGATAVTVSGVLVGAESIQTLVGDGTPGFSAAGAGPGLVSSPSSLTLDNAGVVYFSDRGNARIRCFNPTSSDVERAGITIPAGHVRTLVGNGTPGNSGDGGDGPSAQIDTPLGLFVQSRGDNTPVALYFSDAAQNVVRMLNLTADDDLALATDELGRVIVTIPAASVATVAGGPNTPGFPNAPAFAGDGAPPPEARFSAPSGIAVTTAAGRNAHFFVADRGNDRLRRFGAPSLAKTNN